MQLGDVWVGGHEKTRVMSVEELKAVLKRTVPEEEVEHAFSVETIDHHDDRWEFSTNYKGQCGMAAIIFGITTCELGFTVVDTYTYLAVPKERHRFVSPDRAEDMFKWAVQNCWHSGKPVFKRGWFLVTEAVMASHISLFMTRMIEKKQDCSGRPLSRLWRHSSVQGPAESWGRDAWPELYDLMTEQEGTCLVKVKNNRRFLPSRKLESPGFFFR
ncbi:unnamed protein product [Ostreobium quekettii]|uniref:Uncharacterized protein n=1 Tax=Ostreobium quekettii TaxID=121088 RepID=A0A8S1J154_9CHLO|nr:unnamed protein product [Ostreobium quekettii]|eukprot:evm.model.scf_157.1 EVM.evm.TU.scf_157.1   scf_157:27956-28600(-)